MLRAVGASSRHPATALVWCLALLLAAVCIRAAAEPESASSDLPVAEREKLEQRVRDRWQYLLQRNFDKVWQYSTPNYRSIFPKQLFAHKFSYAVDRELTGLEVVNYDAGAAVASVAVRVMSRPVKQTSEASVAIGAVPITGNEQWLKVDGQWWYSANE